MCNLISILTLPSPFGLALCVQNGFYIISFVMTKSHSQRDARARAHVNAKVPPHCLSYYLYDTFKVISVYNLKKSTISLWPNRTQMLTHTQEVETNLEPNWPQLSLFNLLENQIIVSRFIAFSLSFFFFFVLESVPKESKTDK